MMTAGNNDHDVDRAVPMSCHRVSARPVGYVISNSNQWMVCMSECTQTACHCIPDLIMYNLDPFMQWRRTNIG